MRLVGLAALLTSSLAIASPAWAARPVGLGVAAGVAIPSKGDITIDPAFAWGFYTDIPIISTFSISPSTVLYRIDPETGGGAAATDVSLTFKFVVVLGPIEPYAGLTAGVTSSTKLAPHVGGVLGLSLNLVSNLDVFVQGNYRLTLEDGGNVGTFHIFAGPLFRFGTP